MSQDYGVGNKFSFVEVNQTPILNTDKIAEYVVDRILEEIIRIKEKLGDRLPVQNIAQ